MPASHILDVAGWRGRYAQGRACILCGLNTKMLLRTDRRRAMAPICVSCIQAIREIDPEDLTDDAG